MTDLKKRATSEKSGVQPSSSDDALPAKPYEPKPHERARMEAYLEHRKSSPPAPRLKVMKRRGKSELSLDHPEPKVGSVLLMQALGTHDADFLDGLLSQLVNIGSHGRDPDERGTNFVLSIVKGINPKDQVEAMLAAQMAAVHLATMTFARRLDHVDTIPQQDSAERAFNKLARTFAAQLDALKRYRAGGEQRMTVRHVTVSDGGRAIVGNVAPAAGASNENRDQPHAPDA